MKGAGHGLDSTPSSASCAESWHRFGHARRATGLVGMRKLAEQVGRDNRSAIGTVVDRCTRFVLLLILHLPDGGHTAEAAAKQCVGTGGTPVLVVSSVVAATATSRHQWGR